jgi:hypothetical protein
MNRRIENLISRASEPGPKTLQGKQAVRMNAFQHGLTGQSLMMTAGEAPYYQSLSRGFQERFQPADVFEKQLLQKIIDTNWRLNVCAALECNLTATGTATSLGMTAQDERTDAVFAHCHAWTQASDQFEKLGRYEAGLNRRLLSMVAELERVQNARHEREAREEADLQASFDALAPLRTAVQSVKEADAESTASEEAAPAAEPDIDFAVTVGS